MNICIFIQNISHNGGTERMAVSLANELVLKGHSIHLVSLEAAEQSFFPLSSGITMESLHLLSAKLKTHYFSAVRKLRKKIREKNIEVIIDVDVILSLISIRAARHLNTKVIAWEHYNYFIKRESKARIWGRKLAAKKAAAVVTLTEEDAGFYKANCKCNAKITAIPNFITKLPEKVSPLTDKVVLSIGHLIHRKGFDLLIRAWGLIKEADREGWKLHIVGEGEEKNNLLAIIRSLQLDHEVVFFPPTSDIEKHYLSASVYAMSSRAEGLPMVLIEAKTYGLPLVSFACRTGPADIIRAGADGCLAAPEDVSALSEKLTAIINNDTLRRSMAVSAREDAKRFLSDVIIQQWDDLLNNL